MTAASSPVSPKAESRIDQCFSSLKAKGKTALVTFTMAFDPSREASLALLKSLPEAGSDIIEIGMPFSDPMADGPAIQAAGLRALAAGASLRGVLEIVAEFRKTNSHTPLILMGYVNPLLAYGMEEFTRDAAKAGADGLIIVDLPPEEDSHLFGLCEGAGLALIKLTTPTTDNTRMQIISRKASGFIYYVSVTGVTGTRSASSDSIKAAMERFRKDTALPIVAGFGIKTAEQAKALAGHVDGVVVGSALVSKIAEEQNPDKAVAAVLALVREIASGLG